MSYNHIEHHRRLDVLKELGKRIHCSEIAAKHKPELLGKCGKLVKSVECDDFETRLSAIISEFESIDGHDRVAHIDMASREGAVERVRTLMERVSPATMGTTLSMKIMEKCMVLAPAGTMSTNHTTEELHKLVDSLTHLVDTAYGIEITEIAFPGFTNLLRSDSDTDLAVSAAHMKLAVSLFIQATTQLTELTTDLEDLSLPSSIKGMKFGTPYRNALSDIDKLLLKVRMGITPVEQGEPEGMRIIVDAQKVEIAGVKF